MNRSDAVDPTPFSVIEVGGSGNHAAPTLTASSVESIEALVESHGDFVWRSLRRLGVPDAATDDATQRVFEIACGKMATITKGRERAFLFGVVVNVAAHARRAIARRREVATDEAFDVVDEAPLPDAIVDRHRARALLDVILAGMPIEARTVFVMYEIEELTMTEIAEALAIPSGTVASRLRRGRELFDAGVSRIRAQLGATRGAPRATTRSE